MAWVTELPNLLIALGYPVTQSTTRDEWPGLLEPQTNFPDELLVRGKDCLLVSCPFIQRVESAVVRVLHEGELLVTVSHFCMEQMRIPPSPEFQPFL
jgi:hypothetical protein